MTRTVSPDDVTRFLNTFDGINRAFSSVGSFPHGLTLSKSDLVALEAISKREGITMTALAKSLGIRFSTATGIVDRLVDRALVHRSRNHEDRRIVKLMLTEQGKEIVLSHRKQMRSVIEKMLTLLSAGERQSLLTIMEKVAREVRASNGR